MAQNLYPLLVKALEIHSLDAVADRLYIKKGTVLRWRKLRFVPYFYKNDLLRLIGDQEIDKSSKLSDQFYTPVDLAKRCYDWFLEELTKYKVDVDKHVFIEPCAGCGHIYDLLPKDRRIGIDIVPQISPVTQKMPEDIIEGDFLTWSPSQGKYLVIGNPPFGRNGKTALDFMLRSWQFVDYIGFILPPIFNSTGKGSCRNRLERNGAVLLRTENIQDSNYIKPDGSKIAVRTIFQVWAKRAPKNYVSPPKASCRSFVDIYNICVPYKPSRSPSNIDKIGKCDLYLSRSFWGEQVQVSEDFKEIKYQDGYGIVIKKDKDKIMNYIQSFDWSEVCHISTNSSRSIRKDIIFDILYDGGFVD